MITPLSKATFVASLLLLLLLPQSIFAKEIQLYAYNLGLNQDLATGSYTDDPKIPLPSEEFWKVCYPQPPRNTAASEEVETAWARYSEGARMYLVFGMNDCPVGYTNNFQVTTHDFGKWYDAEGAARQEDKMFDLDLLVKREDIEKYPEAAWYGVAKGLLEEVPEDRRASLTHFRVGMAYTLHTAAPNNNNNENEDEQEQDWNVDHSLTLSTNVRRNTNAPAIFARPSRNTPDNRPIYFNPTHRMGRVSYMTLDENDQPDDQEGFDLVDWFIDQKLNPDYILYSCFFEHTTTQSPLPWHKRQLYFMRSDDNKLVPPGCTRIMLTTSSTQLEHTIDLWNQRQLAWSRYEINMHTWPPLYETKYEIVENDVGRLPGIFSKEDIGRMDDLIEGGVRATLPQTVTDVVAVMRGVMGILDMKEDFIPRPRSDYHFSEDDSDDFGNNGDDEEDLEDGDDRWYRVQYAPGNASDEEPIDSEEEEGSWMDDETYWGFPSPNSEAETPGEMIFPPPVLGNPQANIDAVANELQAPSPSIVGTKEAETTEQQQQRQHTRDFHPQGTVHHTQLEEQPTDLNQYITYIEDVLRSAILPNRNSNKINDRDNNNPEQPPSPLTRLANWEKELLEERERSDRKMFRVLGRKQDTRFNPDVEDGDGLNGKREALRESDENEVQRDEERDVPKDGSETPDLGPSKKRKQE